MIKKDGFFIRDIRAEYDYIQENDNSLKKLYKIVPTLEETDIYPSIDSAQTAMDRMKLNRSKYSVFTNIVAST